MTEIPLAEYKKAERELFVKGAKRSFINHAMGYVCFLSLPVTLIFDRIFDTDAPLLFYQIFFGCIVLGWGMGLFFHYLYGFRWPEKGIEHRQAEVESRVRQNLLQRGDTLEPHV